MNGYEYEYVCAEYLKKIGFVNVQVTKSSGDQGIDVIAYKNKKKYGIQCKYYSQPVGNKAIQEAYSGAAFYKCDIAVVMTNNTFTKPAVQLANSLGVQLWSKKDEKCMKAGKLENSHKIVLFHDRMISTLNVFEAIILVISIISMILCLPIGIIGTIIFLILFLVNYILVSYYSWQSICKRNIELLNDSNIELYLNKKVISVKELTIILELIRSRKRTADEVERKRYYIMEVSVCNARNAMIDKYYNQHPEATINEQDYIVPRK